MELLANILFCISVSVDGFTIGCSYGLRNFTTSLYTNIIICLISTFFSSLATLCGNFIVKHIPTQVSLYIGVIFLFILGIYTIIKGLNNTDEITKTKEKISIKESFYLSFAVSIDAFSGTLAYVMAGNTSLLVPLGVGLFHTLFFTFGIVFSRKAVDSFHLPKKLLWVISGLIIIFVALFRCIL